jgi:hypothetical protein
MSLEQKRICVRPDSRGYVMRFVEQANRRWGLTPHRATFHE